MPLPPQDRAALQALERRRQKKKREQRKAWCILLGIVLIIFGLGMLFGWHLGTVHAVAISVPQEQTSTLEQPKSTGGISATITPAVYNSTEPVTPEPVVIESEGNVLSLELQCVMAEMCEKYDVPFALALAVADHESRFDPDAKSSTNDYGLMQINTINFEWLRERGIEPLTYEGNIEAGVLILSQALERHGEMELALMAYNCGNTGAKRLWDKGIYSTEYSRGVMQRYAKWVQVLEGN